MLKINPKINKKIIIISILFAMVLSGLFFAYEKSGLFFIEGAENKDMSKNGGLNSLGDRVKETTDAPKLVIADGFSGNNIDSGNDNLKFSKIAETIAEIGEIFFGIEKKDALYFIGREFERKPKIIKVPLDYGSVQLAIDNASSKDTIEVSPGEYKENIVMKEGVSVIGLNISDEGRELNSETSEFSSFPSLRQVILDGNNFGNVVTFRDGITNETTLSGFTIKNSGKNLSGILIENSSPLIENNIITENEYDIYIKGDSFPIIRKNTITFANKGIQVYNFENREDLSKPAIIDNLIADNKVGVDLYQSSALIDHNTISYNNHYKTYLGPTYGIYIGKSLAEISNNIVSDSGICDLCSGIVADKESKSVIVSFNDIWNNKNDFVCFGECILEDNNLSEDPLFVDSINGSYKLSEDSPLIGKAKDGADVGVRW